MSAGAGRGEEGIRPTLAATREARGFLARHFAATRLIAAPFLSERAGGAFI